MRGTALFIAVWLCLIGTALAQTTPPTSAEDPRVKFVRDFYGGIIDRANEPDPRAVIDSAQGSLLKRIDLQIYEFIPVGEDDKQWDGRKFGFDHSLEITLVLAKLGLPKEGTGGMLQDLRLATETESNKMKHVVVWTIHVPDELVEKTEGYRTFKFTIFLVDENTRFGKASSPQPPVWRIFGVDKKPTKDAK